MESYYQDQASLCVEHAKSTMLPNVTSIVPSLRGGLAGDGRPRRPARGDQAGYKIMSRLAIVVATMPR